MSNATAVKNKNSVINEPSVHTTPKLTAHDRCDRCGAQAYHRVYRNDTPDLLFCNHHAQKTDKQKLKAGGWQIDDQSSRLYEDTKPGGSKDD